MAATAILKIAFIAITHQQIVRFQQNGMPTKARWQKLYILKSKMADGRHFEIVKSPHFSKKSSDFNDIWYTTADIEPDYSHVTKN